MIQRDALDRLEVPLCVSQLIFWDQSGFCFDESNQGAAKEKTGDLPQSHNIASFESVVIKPQSTFVD
jgi:hypothetical protein